MSAWQAAMKACFCPPVSLYHSLHPVSLLQLGRGTEDTLMFLWLRGCFLMRTESFVFMRARCLNVVICGCWAVFKKPDGSRHCGFNLVLFGFSYKQYTTYTHEPQLHKCFGQYGLKIISQYFCVFPEYSGRYDKILKEKMMDFNI